MVIIIIKTTVEDEIEVVDDVNTFYDFVNVIIKKAFSRVSHVINTLVSLPSNDLDICALF